MNRKVCLVLLSLLLLLNACRTATPAAEAPEPLTVYGFIEADEIAVVPVVGGRVVALLANVGDEVAAGVPLARLDDRIERARVERAKAKVVEARARLDLARRGVPDAQLRSAEAQLAQAEAGRLGACQARDDALAILDNPQEIDRQIAVTRAQLRAAEAGLLAAGAYKDVAEIGQTQFFEGRDALDNLPDKITVYDGPIAALPVDLPQEILDFIGDNPPPGGTYRVGDTEIVIDGGNVSIYRYITVSMPVAAHFAPNAYWQSWVGVNTAQAGYDGLRRILALLYNLRENPTEILAQVEETAALCEEAVTQVNMAQAQVDGLRAGATVEELDALEALYAVAQAELESAEVALSQQTLAASAAGLVLERPLEVSELAGPNTSLYVLADLDVVYLTLYVPSRDLERIDLDRPVVVRTDNGAPPFQGEVTFIGQEAEFPPSSVPQPEDLAALVFAVRVRIENPDHLLKPGTLASTTFD